MEENDSAIWLPALLFLGVILYVIVRVIGLVRQLFYEYRKFSVKYDANPPRKHAANDHPVRILDVAPFLNNYSYFKKLSRTGKEKFTERLINFIADKNFVGMNGFEVTDEMRVLISATAIQITFGLDIYILPHFHTIKIYPKIFFSKLMDAELKGGTSPGGVVMLSWKDFQEGHATLDDKINLGLHEMAHAVLLDMLHGTTSNRQLEAEIGNWETAGNVEMEKLRKRNPHFLRAYGGVNEHEFFAVSVEHFFEAPAEFKRKLPVIFSRLCILLNQDPTNILSDYKYRSTSGIFS